MSKIKYRRDIDGLRAIAVLSVILFHMNPTWLPGGFLGVDIFFVISGFLITTIIHKQIIEGSFSFYEFYSRRMKRILPAFFTVIFVTLLMGYLLLLPLDLISLAKSAFSTLIFASNFYFSRSAGGYFEANDTLPLLHTWSLAVEEQYYFIWPILLIFFLKIGGKHKTLVNILVIVAFLSFAGATIIALGNSTLKPWNYYMLPSRAGELIIGSLLAVFLNSGSKLRESNYWSFIGIALIISSLIIVDDKSIFPGVNALWACLGVATIIYSKPTNFINKLLSYQPMTYIGLISYSLYLWHWPILAFMRYINPNNQEESQLTNFELFYAAILTWLLAHITYKYIESRTRSTRYDFKNTFSVYLAIPTLIISLIFGYIYKFNGVPNRFFTSEPEQIMFSGTKNCTSEKAGECMLSIGNGLKVALYGDSHAQAFKGFVTSMGDENDLSVVDFSSPSCTPAKPIDMVSSFKDLCDKTREDFNNNPTIDVIFLVGRWENNFFNTFDNTIRFDVGAVDKYYEKLKARILDLNERGIKKVVLIEQVPKYNQDIKKLLIPFNSSAYEIDDKAAKANKIMKQLSEETGTFLVDLTQVLCPKNKCSPFNDKGTSLYYDDDHLSIAGAKWVYEKYKATSQYGELINFISN